MAQKPRPKPSPLNPQPSDLEITGFTDQNNDFYVRFELGDREVVMLLEEVTESGGFAKTLARAGILAATASARSDILKRVQNTRDWPQTTFIARQPGHYCGAFVNVDETVIGKPTVENLQPEFEEPPVPLARVGSFDAWQEPIRRFGRGQSNIQFACALALTGPVLELLTVKGNILIEMAGGTSRGKTTTLNVAASFWGALTEMAGSIIATWRMTDVGMERLLFARASTFLPIDEVNAAGVSKAAQGAMVGAAAFVLGGGTSKVTDHRRTVRHARIAVYSTSNTPISELPFDADQGAAEVRFITIPVEAGAGLGIWDRLPAGYDDPGEAADALTQALAANHGWGARRFLRRLVDRRQRDEPALKAQLDRYLQQFLEQAQIPQGDGVARRRAMQFGAIYAAGQLAVDMEVLPFPRLLRHVLAVYRRAEGLRLSPKEPGSTPMDRIQQHLAANVGAILDLDKVDAPYLSDLELDRGPGFLKTFKGRRCLLVRGTCLRRLFGVEDRRALQELEASGNLVIVEGSQIQTRVRADEPKTRVYAIVID